MFIYCQHIDELYSFKVIARAAIINADDEVADRCHPHPPTPWRLSMQKFISLWRKGDQPTRFWGALVAMCRPTSA